MHPRSQLAVQRLAADAQLAGSLRDIAARALQRLDVYVPARATAGAAPVIFMVHGGG